MKNNEAENRIQQKIVMHFRAHHQDHIIFSVPNEGRNPKEQMAKIATGLMAGVSDLILLTPEGKTIFVEVKTPDGTQSPKQVLFQNRVEKIGFEYHVVRSVDDALSIIA